MKQQKILLCFSPWKKRWGKCDRMWAKWIRLIWVCWLLLCRIRGSAHEEAKPRLFNTIAIFNLAFNSPAAFAHPNNQSLFAIFTEFYNIDRSLKLQLQLKIWHTQGAFNQLLKNQFFFRFTIPVLPYRVYRHALTISLNIFLGRGV